MWYIFPAKEAVIELIIKILASGSSGNSIFFEAGEKAILLDAGLSCRELTRRADAIGADLSRVTGILISHEHVDHIQGAPMLAKKLKCPVFLNKATHEELFRRGADFSIHMVEHFETGETLYFNGLAARTFSVPHDAADPAAFVISCAGLRIGVVTDIGHITHLVEERLRGCHVLIIEANHDTDMLDNGPYPPDLKRRIKGRNGHLSNGQCAELLHKLFHPELSHIVLAHLSETNNTPMLAQAAVCRCLPAMERLPRIITASQSRPITLRVTPGRGGE